MPFRFSITLWVQWFLGGKCRRGLERVDWFFSMAGLSPISLWATHPSSFGLPISFPLFLKARNFCINFLFTFADFFLFPINFVFNQPFCNFKFFVPNNSMVKSNNLKNFGYYIIVFDLMSFTSTRIFGNIIL
jgi:hypothetical protein